MSPAASDRLIVEDVLGRAMTREIWTSNYYKALPLSIQDFELAAVLPAVFYMFRFGYRRGKGSFLATFGDAQGTPKQRRQSANIDRIAATLSTTPTLDGFDSPAEKAILGDLLLCFCLENVNHQIGRTSQVQRLAPTHYMASWIDLPESVANLRFVPEMIVAMLADQKGESIQESRDLDRTWFAVGKGFEDNLLLRAFHQGVNRVGEFSSRTSDSFQEEAEVGIDQLLMIRLAQELGAAPEKLRGGEGQIANQHPIAERATRHFSEDLRTFIRHYAEIIPRHSFVDLLESCMAIGLTSIVTSTVDILMEWSETGRIQPKIRQTPIPIFVDCSTGVDKNLRLLAEQSMDDFMRRIEGLPVVLMALRLLDNTARFDRKLRDLSIPTRPYATEWLNLLGDLLNEDHSRASAILDKLDSYALELAEKLQDDNAEISQILNNSMGQPNPVWRLAEALTLLQGRKNSVTKLVGLVDSSLLVGRPNALSAKRRIIRTESGSGSRKARDARSLILSDSTLDYLVHRHVLQNGKGQHRPLAFRDFLTLLNTRYGFCIDTPPPGMPISNDLLQKNRTVLERRLRDLGLFVGVNDAEAMKCLYPRYYSREDVDVLD